MLSPIKECTPCKQPKAPVFKMGDIVEDIYTGAVFKVGMIATRYGSQVYGPMIHNERLRICEIDLKTGHVLKKYQAKK